MSRRASGYVLRSRASPATERNLASATGRFQIQQRDGQAGLGFQAHGAPELLGSADVENLQRPPQPASSSRNSSKRLRDSRPPANRVDGVRNVTEQSMTA